MDKEQIMLNNALVLAKQEIEARLFTDICYDINCIDCPFTNTATHDAPRCLLKERIHKLNITTV